MTGHQLATPKFEHAESVRAVDGDAVGTGQTRGVLGDADPGDTDAFRARLGVGATNALEVVRFGGDGQGEGRDRS